MKKRDWNICIECFNKSNILYERVYGILEIAKTYSNVLANNYKNCDTDVDKTKTADILVLLENFVGDLKMYIKHYDIKKGEDDNDIIELNNIKYKKLIK